MITAEQDLGAGVELFSLYPGAHAPEPCSQSIGGALPVRASQLCAPIVAASGLGWQIYPPLNFALRLDGEVVEWSKTVANRPTDWQSLANGINVPLPDYERGLASLSEQRRRQAEDAQLTHLPFLNSDPRDPSVVEMHLGVLARVRPGWSLLVRSVPNARPIPGLRVLEGVVESWYRNFVPVIVRLTDPGRTVLINRTQPFACLQAVPNSLLEAAGRHADVHQGLSTLPEDVWQEMLANVSRRMSEPSGSYRRTQRAHRAGCPVPHGEIGD